MFGTQKITEKMMNDKLVIKAGGGFMLVDEFLKNNAYTEMMETMVSNSPDEKVGRKSLTATGRASPKRTSMVASPKGRQSPKRVGM